MRKEPLISCLCVTRNKPGLLEKAIGYFTFQTYHRKELLIVYEDDDIATKEKLREYTDRDIRAIEVPANPKLTLGQLRNLAIQRSSGEYFCQWDDDDWYHSQRLELQMNCLRSSGKAASVLVNWLMFDKPLQQAYFSFTKVWEGSILCRKDLITSEVCYDNRSLGEETNFIFALVAKNCLYPLVMPSLYIYIYHGNNSWNRDHFGKLFSRSQPLSAAVSRLVGDVLDGRYDHRKASQLLSSPKLLREIDYFNSFAQENILNEPVHDPA